MKEIKTPLFQIREIEVKFPLSNKKLIYDVDFSIYKNEIILFTGQSGIGKSTLFLLLKGVLQKIYSCEISGRVKYMGQNIIEKYPEILEEKIGYLGQNPYAQIVNTKVIDELVFGMENYGFTREKINKNAIINSNLFGLFDKLETSTRILSGGLCQRLNLASIICYEPDIILLDEPVSFLDSKAAKLFYETLIKLKGKKTIIIIEHSFDEIIDIIDRVLIFDSSKNDGSLLKKTDDKLDDKLNNKLNEVRNNNYIENILPILNSKKVEYAYVKYIDNENQLYYNQRLENTDNKKILYYFEKKTDKLNPDKNNQSLFNKNNDLKIKLYGEDIFFKYNKNSEYIFKKLTFNFTEGQIIGIIGENGSGKTTFLKLISGIEKAEKGKINLFLNEKKIRKIYKYISILFQNSESSFFFPLVKDEIFHQIKKEKNLPFYLKEILNSDFFDFNLYCQRSSFTLSEGEKRRLGFLIQLLQNRPVRLYDEPTYALDNKRIEQMIFLIKEVKKDKSIQIVISHDLNFLKAISDIIYKIEEASFAQIS